MLPERIRVPWRSPVGSARPKGRALRLGGRRGDFSDHAGHRRGRGRSRGAAALVLAATVSARWFNSRCGLIVGLLTASSATGQLVFLPLLASVAAHSGWRNALLIVCVLLAATAIVAALLMRDRPSNLGLRPYGAPIAGAASGITDDPAAAAAAAPFSVRVG
jgi:MFS family permease